VRWCFAGATCWSASAPRSSMRFVVTWRSMAGWRQRVRPTSPN
jgi:hypothetical protein